MNNFITVPNPILRKKSKLVNLSAGGDQKTLKLINEMKKALVEAQDPPGVGLSAVQIDKLWRVFLAREDVKSKPKVFINPKITWRSKEMTNGIPGRENKFEGCLSIPGYFGLVKRHKKIKLRWQMSDGRWQRKEFSGFIATVIQHEMDHLNGILFIDRVLEQRNKIYKLEQNRLIETVL